MSEAAKSIQVMEREQAPTIAPTTSEAGALLSMVERASRDPAVDLDKMRELLAMRKEIVAAENEQRFNDAMAKAQSEMEPVRADADNTQTKSKYASYYALDKAVRPIYTKHGFGLSFNTEPGAPQGEVRIVCYVTCSGHTRKYQIDMPADGKGAKGGDVMTKTHATGSATTYGQRYLLKAIFNIAVGGDDDGNAAANTEDYITAAQVKELTTLITSTGGDVARFCEFAKVPALENIYASRFEAAKAAIERAAEQRKAAKQ